MTTYSGKGDYEVGYGKPPKEHQFKAKHGKSKGPRRKRRLSLQSIVETELLERLSLPGKGKTSKLPAIQIVLRQSKIRALNGNEKSVLLLMKLAQLFLPQEPEDEGEEHELNAAELAVMESVMAAKALFAGESDGD